MRCRSVVAANISQLVKLVSRVEIASIEVSVSINGARKVLASENLRWIAQVSLLVSRLTHFGMGVVL